MGQLLVLLNVILAATLIFLIDKTLTLMMLVSRLYSELQIEQHKTLIESFKEKQ